MTRAALHRRSAPVVQRQIGVADGSGSALQRILDSPAFGRLKATLTSGVVQVSAVPGSLPLIAGAQQWRHLTTHRPIDSTAALAAHLLAGDEASAVPLLGYGKDLVRAVGFSYRPDALTTYLSLDLDGVHAGYEPERVIGRLCEHFGADRFLIHSGSGRVGRYRCSALVPEMKVGELSTTLTGLLTDLGFPPLKGGLEIYPATTNGRLPFGLGGRAVYRGPALEPDEIPYRWEALAEWLLDTVPLDLVRRVAPRGQPATKTSALVIPPPQPPRAPRAIRAWKDPWTQVRRWWGRGVETGERDAALFTLVRDCRRAGLTEAGALDKMQQWIRQGNLARSSIGSKSSAVAYERDVHVPDIVRRVYARPPPRLRPVPLSAREVAAAVALADERCPDDATEAIMLLLDILPWLKSAWLAGLDGVRLSSKRWATQLNRRAGYPGIRAALGIFVRGRNYLAGKRSMTWHLTSPTAFEFDAQPPKRSLFSTRKRPIGQVLADARAVAAKERRRRDREQRHATVAPAASPASTVTS